MEFYLLISERMIYKLLFYRMSPAESIVDYDAIRLLAQSEII